MIALDRGRRVLLPHLDVGIGSSSWSRDRENVDHLWGSRLLIAPMYLFVGFLCTFGFHPKLRLDPSNSGSQLGTTSPLLPTHPSNSVPFSYLRDVWVSFHPLPCLS